MNSMLLGFVVIAATALVFWLVLPVRGEPKRWILQAEPLVTLGLVIALVVGGALVLAGALKS